MDKPNDFAEKLVDDLVNATADLFTAVKGSDAEQSAALALVKARNDVKQALRVPSPHSEGFLTVRDEFMKTALPQLMAGESVSVETAAEICGVPVSQYRWRIHYPKVAAILAYEQADACMAARKSATSTPEGGSK